MIISLLEYKRNKYQAMIAHYTPEQLDLLADMLRDLLNKQKKPTSLADEVRQQKNY